MTCVDSVAIGVEETKPVINAGLGRSWVASHDPKTIHIFSIASRCLLNPVQGFTMWSNHHKR